MLKQTVGTLPLNNSYEKVKQHYRSLETCWEVPAEGFVSLIEQQLEELKNATTDNNQTSAEPMINKKKKKKKKKKERMDEEFYEENEEEYHGEEEETAEATPPNPYGQWESVKKPYNIFFTC